jgi:hypothetical protein
MKSVYFRNFKLGQHYYFQGQYSYKILRFIQVTPKGFNFLDEKTNKCFFKSHLYSKLWYNKELPKEFTEVKVVAVPEGFYFTEIIEEKTNV